jgi:hypothetical protein
MTLALPRLLRPGGLAAAVLGALLLSGGGAVAQDKPTRTPSPPGAKVYFIDIKDGQHLPQTFTVRFGLRGMGLAPAGIEKANTGHHHLLVDAPLPPADEPVPNDPQHLHFGAGQTEADVTLAPGPHTLQLLFADRNHVQHDPPVASEVVHVVVDAAAPDAASADADAMPPDAAGHDDYAAAQDHARTPSPEGAAVYFVYPKDGYVIYPTSTIRFGLTKMGVAPAGVEKPNTGHHHLLIDADPPDPSAPIPNDPQHLHFGGGQTEVKITLPEGEHTLQLVLGDQNHMMHNPPVMSERIKVMVRPGGPKRGK